jgi:autotransporter-associated beta strand protein
VKQFIQNTGIWIVGMRMFARNFTTSWLVVFLILLVISKAGAAEITLTNANNTAINSTINTNAFNSTKGLTNTITWTNTTTAWTNYFASPAGGAPYFNGLNWGSSESVNGLVIGGTYAATNVGTLVGANPFVNVGSATGLIKVNGSFAGTNGLTKTGAGQLNFQSSFNTFTGGLTIEAGRVNFGSSNNIPTSNNLNLKGGEVNFGAVNLNLTFANVQWGDGKLTGGAGSSLTAASYTLTNTVDITNGFVLAGAGGLNKSSGAGNFVLSGTNTFGGAGVTNTVSAGTLSLGNASALGNTSNSFELRTGGTLNVSNISPTFSTFTFAGGNLSGGTTNILTADSGFVVTGGTLTISNRLAGSGGFTQNGSGTTTLSRTNAYSGATTVSQGTLLVGTNGSIASSSAVVNGGLLNVNGAAGAITVNTGGSLGGSGNVGGVNLKSGSSLRPGNSPGLLTASSATIDGGSTYSWEISSVTGTAGTNWDLLSVTGLLDMSGVTSENKWNLVVTGDSGFAGWSGTDSYSYVFAQAASVSGFSSTVGADVTNLFNITTSGITSLPNASSSPNGDFKVVVGSAGGLTTLNLMAVPEPSAASLMGIGLGSLFILRRFRRRER